jgi:hypothetical protein
MSAPDKKKASLGRLNDLNGHDLRRVVVPLGELGFIQLGFIERGGFDVLGVGIIVNLELEKGAAGDLNFSSDTCHFDASSSNIPTCRNGMV